MNISSSVGQAAAYGQQVTSSVSNKPKTPINTSVQSTDPVSSEKGKESSPDKQAVPNFVIDEQAIALFEQSQTSSSLNSSPNQSESSFANSDQPLAKNETAVANYKAVGNLAERESVQKMFGVDLFA